MWQLIMLVYTWFYIVMLILWSLKCLYFILFHWSAMLKQQLKSFPTKLEKKNYEMLNCNYILDCLCLYYNQNTTDVVAIFDIYSYDINFITHIVVLWLWKLKCAALYVGVEICQISSVEI